MWQRHKKKILLLINASSWRWVKPASATSTLWPLNIQRTRFSLCVLQRSGATVTGLCKQNHCRQRDRGCQKRMQISPTSELGQIRKGMVFITTFEQDAGKQNKKIMPSEQHLKLEQHPYWMQWSWKNRCVVNLNNSAGDILQHQLNYFHWVSRPCHTRAQHFTSTKAPMDVATKRNDRW